MLSDAVSRILVPACYRYAPSVLKETVLFNAATPEQAETLSLAKTRHGYLLTLADVLRLQDAIRAYLRTVLDLPAMAIVLSREEEMKQRIQNGMEPGLDTKVFFPVESNPYRVELAKDKKDFFFVSRNLLGGGFGAGKKLRTQKSHYPSQSHGNSSPMKALRQLRSIFSGTNQV